MKYFFFFLLTSLALQSFAQKTTVTYFDENGNTTKEKNAVTFRAVSKENDSMYIVRYYKSAGPIINQESYKDEKLTRKYGIFVWYNDNGDFDSSQTYNSNGEKVSSSNNQKKIREINADNKDTLSYASTKDTLLALTKREDTIKYNIMKSRNAELSGGENEWINYLKNNINTAVTKQIPKYKNLSDNKAIVVVSFLVLKDGSVGDIYVTHSSGYPFDKEAVRLIAHSPRWSPATMNGKPVVFRQKQRIIFSK